MLSLAKVLRNQCARSRSSLSRNAPSATFMRLNKQGDALLNSDIWAAGLAVLGSSGSGKSSILNQLAVQASLHGSHVVFCTSKPSDARTAMLLARLGGCERIRELRLGRDTFSLSRFTQRSLVGQPGAADELAQVLTLPLRLQNRSGGASDPHWASDANRLVRSVSVVFHAARVDLTTRVLVDVLVNLPRSTEDASEDDWRHRNPLTRALAAINRRHLTAAVSDDVDRAAAFLLRTFPAMPHRTRESTVSTLLAPLDPLLYGDVGAAVNGEMDTWSPKEVFEAPGATIFAMPSQISKANATMQRMLLSAVQKELARRTSEEVPHPVIIIADEFATLVDPEDDLEFMRVARDRRGAMFFAVQDVSSIRAAMGGTADSQAAADAILGLPAVKFFAASTDVNTMRFASQTFAETYQPRVTLGSSSGGDPRQPRSGTNASVSMELKPDVTPHEFSTLRRGGPENGFIVEAFCSVAGRVWKASRKTSLKVAVPQLRLDLLPSE